MLGNAFGRCPYDCRFCSVKATEKVTAAEIRSRFHLQWQKYEPILDGPYHPLIYNEGNVTNPLEFPREQLDYILEFFRGDPRVQYVSLNSREHYATEDFLKRLQEKNYPFPVHFIFGLESFSPKTDRVLGKNVAGELGRFADKLLLFGGQHASHVRRGAYCFGLDVNLLFLPELYLEGGESRRQTEQVRQGIEQDVAQALTIAERGLPVLINIHPYHRVEALPFENAELGTLIESLPRLQSLVDQHNAQHPQDPVHIFIGIEGKGYGTKYWRQQMQYWGESITLYNETGSVRLKQG
jgi:hypothetical protein